MKIQREVDTLAHAAQLLVECEERGRHHELMSQALDKVILQTGPWQMAHFMVTSDDAKAVDALRAYLEDSWKCYLDLVDQLIGAVDWTRETGELISDFGAH
ncbi:MAG: hypothetical protein ACE5JP_00990 [Candidatus Bipolaricaulia bacterium]